MKLVGRVIIAVISRDEFNRLQKTDMPELLTFAGKTTVHLGSLDDLTEDHMRNLCGEDKILRITQQERICYQCSEDSKTCNHLNVFTRNRTWNYDPKSQ